VGQFGYPVPMRTNRLEFGVWAALTFADLCLDVGFVIVVIYRASRGTLGMWEPPIFTIMALTFLLIVGGYAVHLTNPRRRPAAGFPDTGQQFPGGHQDQHRGEDHEGSGPGQDSGKDETK
jgi:hypothetical protein